MKTLLTLFFSLLCASALAQNHVTASITVTNLTTNGMTMTVNSSVRTFTNNVVLSSVQVLTNADATGCGSKTNLFNQIALNPFSLVLPPQDTGSNTFSLTAISTNPLVVTASAGWAIVTYSTQTVSSAVAVRIPVTIESASQQTNIDSGLVAAINGAPNTNSINQNSTAANQLLGTTKSQTATGQTILNNTSNQFSGSGVFIVIAGNVTYFTNGYFLNPVLSGAVLTNVSGDVIFDNGGNSKLRADSFTTTLTGPNGGSLQLGLNSIGIEDSASNFRFIANSDGTKILNTNGEPQFIADFTGANLYDAQHNLQLNASSNGVAVSSNLTVGGNSAVTGSSSVTGSAVIGGGASIAGLQTNASFVGNMMLSNSSLSFVRSAVTSLANGNNAGVTAGTHVFVEVSGPTSAFSINGISAGRDGQLAIFLNQTGQAMTVANESGVDSTAANRIRTLTGADVTSTGNCACTFIYSAAVSRWIFITHNP